MMEERYHATAQNRFYPDMSNVIKNITVEPTYVLETQTVQPEIKMYTTY